MIQIENIRGLKANSVNVNFERVYVGRASGGWKASVLGNPFIIGRDGDRKVSPVVRT